MNNSQLTILFGESDQAFPETMDSGEVKIPNGKLEASVLGGGLMYDEKIVYNQDQFDLRFIVLAEMWY